MIRELWNDIATKPIADIYEMIDNFKKKENSMRLSLEEQIKYSFALMRADYLDSAMFQLEVLYNNIIDTGVNNKFMKKHPDFQNLLLSSFHILEDCNGHIHVDPTDDCDGCESCCGPCIALMCFLMPFAACDTYCGTNCLDGFSSMIDVNDGVCCNCMDGGLCCGWCDICC